VSVWSRKRRPRCDTDEGVGHVTFNGLRLLTAPGYVMTPRPFSEQLVASAAARVGGRRARIADVGTGSGAIAIAIARVCPWAEIWATDASHCAVALARENVRRHGLEGRVAVRRGDLLGPVPGLFDVVVANLPYIAASNAADHPELEREPFAAVFAAGDGLEPYRRLVDTAPARLAADGVLLLQLHRRIVAAKRAELPALRAALDRPAFAESTTPADLEEIVRVAA
jgi:release factor glutamine methyltransferase